MFISLYSRRMNENVYIFLYSRRMNEDEYIDCRILELETISQLCQQQQQQQQEKLKNRNYVINFISVIFI